MSKRKRLSKGERSTLTIIRTREVNGLKYWATDGLNSDALSSLQRRNLIRQTEHEYVETPDRAYYRHSWATTKRGRHVVERLIDNAECRERCIPLRGQTWDIRPWDEIAIKSQIVSTQILARWPAGSLRVNFRYALLPALISGRASIAKYARPGYEDVRLSETLPGKPLCEEWIRATDLEIRAYLDGSAS